MYEDLTHPHGAPWMLIGELAEDDDVKGVQVTEEEISKLRAHTDRSEAQIADTKKFARRCCESVRRDVGRLRIGVQGLCRNPVPRGYALPMLKSSTRP